MDKQVTDLLSERGKTHGKFTDNSSTSQKLKAIMRQSVNWPNLSNAQAEAIDMICHKLARIGAGDPNEPDHWRDIAGYATLVTEAKDDHPELPGLTPLHPQGPGPGFWHATPAEAAAGKASHYWDPMNPMWMKMPEKIAACPTHFSYRKPCPSNIPA